MKSKKHFKIPKRVADTFKVVISLSILMALYNWLGPTFYKNGKYFEWWIFPYSVGVMFVAVAGWNIIAHRFDVIQRQMKEEDQRKKELAEKRAQLAREAHKDDAKNAALRRQKNQARQNHK